MRHAAAIHCANASESHVFGLAGALSRQSISRIPSAALLLLALSFPARSADSPDNKTTKLPAITHSNRLPAVSLLPDGCVLRDAMIPRYDSNMKLTSVLHAKEMILLDAKTIKASSASIAFYNPDRSQRAHIDLKSARYDQETGVLRAKESVSIVSDNFRANGTSLIYISNSNLGYLYGPVDTIFHRPTNTAMHPPLKPAAVVLISTAMAAAPAKADPPPRPSQDEIHAIEKDAEHNPDSEPARQQTAKDLGSSRAKSAEADTLLHSFTSQASIAISNPATPPADKPLEITRAPEDTHAECDDGMFFDSDKGILIYLKNVRVFDPRFTMTGADELKVFLEKKQPAKQDKPQTPNPSPDNKNTGNKASAKTDNSQPGLLGGASENFGDVDHIVANGRILVTQKAVDEKPPIEASSALLTYNAKTGETILTGGYPWIRQGSTYLRALEPNLNIRIQKDNSFATSTGHWETGGRPKDNPHPSPKPQPAKPKPASH